MDRRRFMITLGTSSVIAFSGKFDLFAMSNKLQLDTPIFKKPNLLFIFTDEHPAKAWSRGIDVLKTPNLDRLADQGLTVTNCISNNPICVPYRATLFTGQHGHQTGFVNNHSKFPLDGDLPSWSKTLKASGYKMGYIGKWHLYPGGERPVWKDKPDGEVQSPAMIPPPELRHGFEDLWMQTSNHNQVRNTYVWDKDGQFKKIEGYAPEFLTDRLIEFIDDAKDSENPFCCVLSLNPPHPPYEGAKEKWVEYYKSIETPFWENVPENDRTPRTRGALKGFYAQLSSVDEEVGRILDKLDQTNLAKDTIVVFTSDHGDLHYAHGEKWKRYPYEESICVPMIIRYPGKIPAGKDDDVLLGTIDIAPTLLGLTGHSEKIDPSMQGMNLSKRLMSGSGPEPKSQFILYNLPEEGHYILEKQPSLRDYRGVRTKRWTFTLQKNPETGKVHPWHLYDNKNDPHQMNNLCENIDYDHIRRELTEQIKSHLQQVGELSWIEDKPRDRSKIPGTSKYTNIRII